MGWVDLKTRYLHKELSTEAKKSKRMSQMMLEPRWVYIDSVHHGTWLWKPYTTQGWHDASC